MSEFEIKELRKEIELLRAQIKLVQNRSEEKIEELSLVRELGMGLLSVHEFENACQLILDIIINNTIAQNCSIMLLDNERNELFLASAANTENKNYVLKAKELFLKQNLK